MDYNEAVQFEHFILGSTIIRNKTTGDAIGESNCVFKLHENKKSIDGVDEYALRLFLCYHLASCKFPDTETLRQLYEAQYGKLAPVFDLANTPGV